MDGYIDNLNHSNIFTSGTNEPSVKTIVVALATAIGAADITLSSDILDDIAATYRRFPMPF